MPDKPHQDSQAGRAKPPDCFRETLERLPGGWVAAFLAAALGLAACVIWLVHTRLWEIGIPGEWTWSYYPPDWSADLLFVATPVLFGLALLAAVFFVLRTRLHNIGQEAVIVTVCLLLALGLIMTLGNAAHRQEGIPLWLEAIPVTASPWMSGYYAEAVHVRDMRAYLRAYPERIRALAVNVPYGHLSDHPPGPVIFHWLVNRLMAASPALTEWFLPEKGEERLAASNVVSRPDLAGKAVSDSELAGIWASALLCRLSFWAALIPIYFLGRLLHSREAGLLGLAAAALIPSLNLFGPYPDQSFALIVSFSLLAALLALRRRSILWAVLSAAAVFLGLQLSMALLIAVAVIGLAGILWLWGEAGGARAALRRTDWIKPTAAWVAAFLLLTLLPKPLFGYDVLGVWRICLAKHATFALHFPRSQVAWTLFNPVEFFTFAGVPAMAALIVAAVVSWRCARRESRPGGPALLAGAVLGVLVLLDFSGKNLGETARLWMMLMPPAVLAGAFALEGLDRRRGWLAAAVLAAGLAQLVVFRLNLQVFKGLSRYLPFGLHRTVACVVGGRKMRSLLSRAMDSIRHRIEKLSNRKSPASHPGALAKHPPKRKRRR